MKFGFIIKAGIVFLTGLFSQISMAADTLDRIKKTQTINIAFREAALPFSYLSESKAPIGYSIDICAKFVEAVKKELKLPQLKVNYIPVTSDTRMAAMTSGQADIECGSTSNNAERREKVNYTLPHFFATIRMIVFADSGINNWQDLKNKKVVITKGTSTDKYLQERDKVRSLNMKLVEAKDHTESFGMLLNKQVDAFAQHDAILVGVKARSKTQEKLVVVGDPLSSEAYAMMLPKGDAAFKKVIDAEMVRMMLDGELTRLYEKWFTKPIQPNGVPLGLPMGVLLRETIRYPSDKVD
ncbi:amino acid ABC transporter substrate-binding protein [Undibacterium sp. CY18W]|uniref:Amino acid ABC transporter substrate-binding protein n=1 Tax=Undibacterium hunanense TaxID=2762292 RepID=A0ABR6ZXQ8_9BURK|nr:amino acid ABC transporter substrate-binding protein [Undibacterium hunanense]MBC3920661.1 amino acid ABC transporter substrate-binding protein [Undibacterium hunanense]